MVVPANAIFGLVSVWRSQPLTALATLTDSQQVP